MMESRGLAVVRAGAEARWVAGPLGFPFVTALDRAKGAGFHLV